jgi:hypothetical protein
VSNVYPPGGALVGLVSLPTLLIMLLAANLLQFFLLITLHVIIISNVMCRGSGISLFGQSYGLLPLWVGEPQLS